MSDFEQNQFPSATRAHWKVLLREINLEKNGHFLARRLSEPDLTGFKGIRIQDEKSLVTFGLLVGIRRMSIADLKP